MQFRILPITIALCCFMLTLRVYDGVTDARHAWHQWARPAIAEESDEDAEAETVEAETAEEGEDADEAGDAETTEAEDAAAEGEEAAAAPAETPAEDSREFSQIEVDILQSLKQRREELDKLEQELKMREAMLGATELRMNERLGELQKLQTDVSALLKQYDQQEDKKILSLVKIYENMKPKNAAQIFEELDMPVMLEVVDKMSERKVAPVLAAMDPKRAKELTIELAEYRRLNDDAIDENLVDGGGEAPASE